MRTAVLLLGLLVLISLSHGENILRRAGDKISEGFDKVKDWAADTYAGQFALGSRDMYRAFDDMQKANWKDSDKYFHARGNFEAAQRGPGGARAAEIISDLRETMNQQSGPYRHREMSAEQLRADSAADQAANRWGREGGDPNVYRPRGLPDEF